MNDDLNLSDDTLPADDATTRNASRRPRSRRAMRITGLFLFVLAVLAIVGYFTVRHALRTQMVATLPQLDGSITVPGAAAPFFGLAAPVTVERDARGVPHIHASSMDDLIFAQGYITAQDRLWQMELLRRHASGELAQVLGNSMLDHDRLQRTLQMRAAADRGLASLPADQRHWLDVYAHGVNVSMSAQRAHLPLEFRVLQYEPAAWSARDSLLIELAMFQDLTTGFTEKLSRDTLAAHLPPEAIADLYPVGSWRDHPPGQPAPDLTSPRPEFEDIPLDKSQTRLHTPAGPLRDSTPVAGLLAVERTLALFHSPCDSCVSGSNGWAVSGARTASGKPMLSNDMHLELQVPGLWYEADLEAQNAAPLAEFHAAGVTLPGTPFVIAGHNAHVAWGFTNLGADVQDLYIEHTRGTPSGAEYQSSDGTWRPIVYHREVIHVRGGADVTLDVPLVHHGDAETPIISGIFPGELRSLSLRWSVYDPAIITSPFFGVDSASDWTSMLTAFSNFGGPAQNLMYADDQGHIGYHAVGRIPVRGDAANPGPLSPVPTDATGPDAAAHEWAGYIPFNQLPQAFDPADGVLATANSRVTLDGYRYPITLNWQAPYRTERIYKMLESTPGKLLEPRRQMTTADMLALQTDVFSELDQIIAQRLVYSIDHTAGPLKQNKTLHQAADLLRNWNGSVDANSAAPAIVNSARLAFWPMLLVPKLAPELAPQLAKGADLSKSVPADVARDGNLWKAYSWGERGSVEEQLMTNTPARWLPAGYANWEDFLAAVVDRGLRDAHAPHDLSTWQQGKAFPVDLEHPIFSRSAVLKGMIGVPIGTGPQPQSGDTTTVKDVGHIFGPSERFTADLSDPDRATLNIVLGQSDNVSSPWFMDQFPDWLRGTTYPLPFTPAAAHATTTHTLILTPR
jgi:penicillin G amidase